MDQCTMEFVPSYLMKYELREKPSHGLYFGLLWLIVITHRIIQYFSPTSLR